MSPGHYLCDILDFNTGIWWCCDDDNITKLIRMPVNIYNVVPYPTTGNKQKNCDERFWEDCFYVVYKNMFQYQRVIHLLWSDMFIIKKTCKI